MYFKGFHPDFFLAVTIQESYALTMDVNILAAGANNVGVGSAG